MREDRLDALLITNDENFIYLVGLPGPYGKHRSNDRPGVAVIPSEGDPLCVVSSAMALNLKPVMQNENLWEYSSIRGMPIDPIVKALTDVGLRNKRVGIEGGLSQRIGMPVNDYMRVLRSIPDVEFVDAAPLLWKMRMIKSETEIEYMKRSTGHH